MGTHRAGHRRWFRGFNATSGRRNLIEHPAPPLNDKALFDAPAFDEALAQSNGHIPLFRQALRHANDVLRKRFAEGSTASALVRQRARLIDALLIRVWRLCITTSDQDPALVAVGGYGRGELHPASDIDLLILLHNGDTSHYQEQIERFLVFLWDIGLEVGHSVRSLDECVQAAAQDITVATNLMESRLLAGSRRLYKKMYELTGPAHIWPGRHFFEAKWKEQIARHHKYHDAASNLEPNVKEGPGGLRDIQMVGWVAKRHFGATTLKDLLGHGFLTETEYRALIDGREFLWRIRFALHVLTGRHEDRLLFDYQQNLAQQFGYQADGHRLAVEMFMKDYYCTIMELSRLNEMLLQLFQEAILLGEHPVKIIPINNRFRSCNGFIEVTHDNVFRRYPFALLEIFLILEQHPDLKGVRATTIRLIREHRHLINEHFRNDLRCRSLFMEILRQPRGITHEMRRMNLYGILAAYLPAFGKIVGQMQYDLFHVYTVDEHTLTVLRNLRRFAVPAFSREFPRCSEIIHRIPKLEILYLGALFHDLAKGRGGDHSELGSREAMAFCLHHGLSRYDARFVAWLVKHHLIMSMTAQRQDISDPGVVTAFAQKVGDAAHLDYLYLLTVADIRGTDPNLWNSWKDALLTELYTATHRALRRGLENPIDKAQRIRETQNTARAMLNDMALSSDAIASLWEGLDDDYFLRHSADEIAWHTRAILRSTAGDLPLVLVREETQRGGTEIFLYTHDQDHLFAMTTRTLDQMGLDIVEARIITTRNGFTLDTYMVLDAAGNTVRNPHRLQEIVSTLKQRLSEGGIKAFNVTRRTTRQLKHFQTPTEVSFSSDERSRRTVMELITSDRPGLLALVGDALVRCKVRVQNAKIATFGARVEDVFFITDSTNQPLSDRAQFKCLRDTISKHLEYGNTYTDKDK